MQTKKKRLTLDLDPPVQQRLKAVAALKGISMRRYCQAAIDKELARDEANGAFAGTSTSRVSSLFKRRRLATRFCRQTGLR